MIDSNPPPAPLPVLMDRPTLPGETIVLIKNTTSSALKEPLRLVLFALGLGWASDILFGHPVALGINALIWLSLILGVLFFLGIREGVRPQPRILLLFIPPLLFFAGMLAIRASTSLTQYNSMACIGLLLLLLYFYTTGDPFRLTFGGCLWHPMQTIGGSLKVTPTVIREAAGQISLNDANRARTASILRGILLAIPVLGLFAYLFANADGVFAQALKEIIWLLPENWGQQIGNICWALGIALLCTGGLAYAIGRNGQITTAESPARSGSLGFTEATIVLGSVIALFAAFLCTQAAYLFGGAARVLTVPDLTFAEYARHGFAELNIVAVLTLVMIGGLKLATRRESVSHERLFAALSTALLALTLPLLFSSFARMQAYEAAYGATELRLYVDLFIGWLGVSLVWCAATLWSKSVAGGLGLYICAIGFLVSLNLINPDAEIAHRNIERYQKTGHMDTYYLSSLSDDAVPEMLRLRELVLAEGKNNNAGCSENISLSCWEEVLQERVNRDNPVGRSWAAWNLSHVQAQQRLAPFRK